VRKPAGIAIFIMNQKSGSVFGISCLKIKKMTIVIQPYRLDRKILNQVAEPECGHVLKSHTAKSFSLKQGDLHSKVVLR
jgi:hypothetical protein